MSAVVVVGKVDGLNLREQECLEGWREPDVEADSCVIPPGLVKCFSGGEGKALLLTTNGQGQKERINSRFAPRLEISQRDNANGSTMDAVVGVKG